MSQMMVMVYAGASKIRVGRCLGAAVVGEQHTVSVKQRREDVSFHHSFTGSGNIISIVKYYS